MTTNFTLIKPDASELAISVVDIGTMFDASTRGVMAASNAGLVYGVGDFVESVTPMQFKLAVLNVFPSDEVAARVALDDLLGFARAARYLRRDATGDYRALMEGNAVLEFDARPYFGRFEAWEATVALNPRFARWTSSAVYTLSGYEAPLAGPRLSLDFGIPANSMWLPSR